MTRKILVITCCVSFLFSRESASQMVFPDGGTTTVPATTVTAGGGNNPFFFGTPSTSVSVTPAIQTNICQCVNPTRCFSASGTIPSDGSGLIDIRIVNVRTTKKTATGSSTGSVTPITSVASSGITPVIASQSSCSSNLELCCPSSGYSCGIRYNPYSNVALPGTGQAPFGAYPWQVVILTSANLYVGAGVLIDHMHVLTVAHKVTAFQTNGIQLKIRMGEWDAAVTTEPIPFQEYNVGRIFVHSQYSSSSLANSIAILRLASNVPLGKFPTVTTACLSASTIPSMRCWVAGWGAQDFATGSTRSIMAHVDVPIVDQITCQNKLRTTKLGPGFELDRNSFMCAGGEPGKDACTGDGGAPLVCPIAGKWFVVGLVAWGIGCGTSDIPGVYINVTNYISWIQTTTRS